MLIANSFNGGSGPSNGSTTPYRTPTKTRRMENVDGAVGREVVG